MLLQNGHKDYSECLQQEEKAGHNIAKGGFTTDQET